MSGSIRVLSLHYNKINESNTFTSGDIVEGKVFLEVTKKIDVDNFFVKLTGDANVRWTESSSDDSNRTNRDHERYFKLKQYFIQESSKKVIQQGRHVYPFRFQLPQRYMPPSFKGNHGWVLYILTVKLIRRWKPASTRGRELTFVPRNYGTNDHLLQPQSRRRDKKFKKLFSSGKMSLTATTDKTGYLQGETIKVFVDVDNSSYCDTKLMYSLKQQQTFIADRRTKRKSTYIIQETKDRIPSGEKNNFILNLKLPRDLIITIENCRLINVQYELKVYLDVSFASDPAVRFPVVILPAHRQCLPLQGPPAGFQPYPPPQPNFVPCPAGQPPPYAELFHNLSDPTALPLSGATVYPDPNAMLPGFNPTPSAPICDPNQKTLESSSNVSYVLLHDTHF